MTHFKPYHAQDLLRTGVLPPDWQSDILSVVQGHGVDTILTGAGSTSRETRSDRRMHVRVADGVAVKSYLPWLWELYSGYLREFSAAKFGKPLFVANLLHTTININQLMGRGAEYEWHVDSNPVTGLLFVTDTPIGFGGSLVFRPRAAKPSIVRPKAGTFICFDARDIPHRVTPLRTNGVRISVPMNYYDSAIEQVRPLDLDEQIYSPAESK